MHFFIKFTKCLLIRIKVFYTVEFLVFYNISIWEILWFLLTLHTWHHIHHWHLSSSFHEICLELGKHLLKHCQLIWIHGRSLFGSLIVYSLNLSISLKTIIFLLIEEQINIDSFIFIDIFNIFICLSIHNATQSRLFIFKIYKSIFGRDTRVLRSSYSYTCSLSEFFKYLFQLLLSY